MTTLIPTVRYLHRIFKTSVIESPAFEFKTEDRIHVTRTLIVPVNLKSPCPDRTCPDNNANIWLEHIQDNDGEICWAPPDEAFSIIIGVLNNPS